MLKKKYRITAVPSGPVICTRQVFTHLIWEMEVIPLKAEHNDPVPPDYLWIPAENLNKLVFPAAMHIPLQTARKIMHSA